jgi:hypothetical protein
MNSSNLVRFPKKLVGTGIIETIVRLDNYEEKFVQMLEAVVLPLSTFDFLVEVAHIF